MYEIHLGGLMFESAPSDLGHAFVVAPEGFTGWYESPGTKGETVSRPATHGDFDLPVYRTPRMLSITGTAIARSEYDLLHMQQEFNGLLSAGESGMLTVMDPLGSMWAMVRRSGEPKFSPHPDGLEADFQVSFKAVDPRKYGTERVSTGSPVMVHHKGNFPADPIVTVPGPRTAPYTITGPGGRVVTVTESLASGQSHTIDFAKGSIHRGSSRRMGVMSHFQPWQIPKGERVQMSISAGSMTVRVTDTYM